MRNIVICCDGTGNEISENNSNVLKFYRCLRKTDRTTPAQLVFYGSGIGTLSQPSTWHRLKTSLNTVLGIATGYGLDESVLEAYEFIVRNYQRGDQIYLFGFSRGAYTVRVLAGLIHKVGLITPEQVNLAGSSLLCYKQYSGSGRGNDLGALADAGADENGPLPLDRFDLAAQFARITSSRWPTIRFVGVWDTVASLMVPRADRFFWPSLEELAFTLRNPSVKTFRQAISIDERRCMFRLKKWEEPQNFWSNRFVPADRQEPQDSQQVWFAGAHADIGGGYPEYESALSKYPLLWMIDEAAKAGLKFSPGVVNQLAWGVHRKNSPFTYVAPSVSGELHKSLNGAWRLLEFLPKSAKYREWPQRKTLFGFYIPGGEPRFIPEGAYVHESVVKRMEQMPDYRPVNLPAQFQIVPLPGLHDRQQISGLESLFLALFDDAQMERFARQFLGARIGQIIQSELSNTMRAARLASELEELGRVDHRLFDALSVAQPGRKDIIDETRAALLGRLSEAEKTAPAPERTVELEDEPEPEQVREPPGNAADESERAWRESLRQLLQSAPAAPEEPPARWMEAAAVVPDFDPLQLQKREATSETPNALTQLAAISDVRPDGRWTLQLRPRREVIARLWKERRLQQALAQTDDYDQAGSASSYRSILEEIAAKGEVKINPSAGYTWMVAARDIAEWFTTSEHQPLDVDHLAVLVERYDTIEPLRKLIGTHFHGRERELEVLRSHRRGGAGSKRVLKISGIGGSGKSALLGKLLLDLERSDELPPPWVYLDFDHPDVQPGDPARLVELIARRLGLLYSGQAGARLFHQLESASAGDPMEAFDLKLPKDARPAELIRALDRVIRRLRMSPSLLIVFDTFEQAQVQGRARIRRFMEIIEKLLAELPYAQVVLSGRSTIDAFPDATPMPLGDLDDVSADAVLQALGVGDPDVRERIARTVGRSPLSLNLAAAALKVARLDLEDAQVFAASARGVEIQGRLYTRFLGHITDAEVRRLAHPGLIVRRVTPGVIREVLAEICKINPASAQQLFDRLPDHVSLFEPDQAAPDETDALRHRQDIREAMIELMTRDPIWIDCLPLIHTRAIEHYSGRPHSITRAEELYHRLMRNDELEELDKLWSDDLAASLGRSWLEPFPERARAWLALRLGRDDIRAPEELRQADWEVYALGEVRTHLESRELQRALAVLKERSDRIAGSPLVPLEVQVLRHLGRQQDALSVCREGLTRAATAEKLQAMLILHLLAAEIGLELRSADIVRHHAGQAQRIASGLQSPRDELRALEVMVRGELTEPLMFGNSNQTTMLDLERAFASASAETLQQSPEITGRIVKTLGSRSRDVLRKAAATFGNRPDQTLIRNDAFRLAELLSQASFKTGGVELLKRLAISVGLSRSEIDVKRIADSAVRFSRQGEAMAAVLDAFGDDDKIRSATAEMFF